MYTTKISVLYMEITLGYTFDLVSTITALSYTGSGENVFMAES
jgi:hypothetical protein